MSADSPRRTSGSRGFAVPAIVPPQVVSDRSILDSAIGFINDVTLAHQPHTDTKDTITWARFESSADISDPRFGEDWELEGNVAPPLLLILGYGLGVQVWAIPANGEAVEVLSWRHGIVSALRVLPTPSSSACMEDNGRADELIDAYAEKRPLMALVDGSSSVGSQPQFCAVNFVSLKTGTQVKTIKFKNPVLDVLANRSAVAITFHERIAVFDARTLEDRLSVTTCYPSPGVNPNPVALGPRWLAYAEHKLLHAKRSGAGCDGDGVASYTATVLNAAKSFGKGLRELGEQVAAGLTGTAGSGSASKNNSFDSGSGTDAKQPGVVTILDIKHSVKDYSPTTGTPVGAHAGSDPFVAHFIAHSEAIVAMEFDNSGMLLLTADRRGHDFHIFRIQPHPVGSSLAAVHHLYVLHRGDTSAKVQNIAFSLDSRWAAVSTLRGTTHVFPITPYGGAMGVRTHTSLHVVNKLSRFHRSAGLSAEGRSSSPISHSESTTFVQSLQPYHNPTLPPFPRPTVVPPLTQLRQPFTLGSPPGSAGLAGSGKSSSSGGGGGSGGGGSSASQRQRLSSLSDDNGKPLSVCAIFAKSRSWLLEPPNATREAPHRIQRKAVDSLFVMAGHGALIQYDLDTKLASNVAKEKICDDTPIELEVEAKAQWNLGRRKEGSPELMPPLTSDNWLIKDRNSCMLTDSTRQYDDADDRVESWLSQVEIITHAGPHRRLWMGPQFVFKTYNTPSGSNLTHVDVEAVEIGFVKPTTAAAAATRAIERSSPLNMPLTAAARATVPVLIESGSYSSIEQSPKLMDRFRHDHLDSDFAVAHGDTRLREDLADAMRESPSVAAAHKDTGRLPSDAASSSDNVPFYDALAEHEHENDDDNQTFDSQRSSTYTSASAAASASVLASALPNICSYDLTSSYESLDSLKKQKGSIAKVVNPLGTVTTVTSRSSADAQTDILDEVVSQLASEDCVIHENCDEALFRPVVAIFCDKQARECDAEEAKRQQELCKPPEVIGNKLIVPVIAKDVDAALSKKEKEKSAAAKTKLYQREQEHNDRKQSSKFEELSSLNKKSSKAVRESGAELAKADRAKEGAANVIESKTTQKHKSDEKVSSVVVVKESSRKATSVAALVEEQPVEFKRMAALPVDKPISVKQANEKSKITVESGGKSEQTTVEEDIKSLTPPKRANEKETAQPTKLPKKFTKDSEKCATKTADTATTSVKIDTAAAEGKTSTKAAIKSTIVESTEQAPKASTKAVTDKQAATKCTTVKTELLNVSHLEDSLIELQGEVDDVVECTKSLPPPPTTAVELQLKDAPTAKSVIDLVQLTEPVAVFAAPPSSKSAKKKKQKQNKSGSNSESEEVEVIVSKTKHKSLETEEEFKAQSSKKSSISSEESYSDLADSILQSSSTQKESAMLASFTQTAEKPKRSTIEKSVYKEVAMISATQKAAKSKIVEKTQELEAATKALKLVESRQEEQKETVKRSTKGNDDLKCTQNKEKTEDDSVISKVAQTLKGGENLVISPDKSGRSQQVLAVQANKNATTTKQLEATKTEKRASNKPFTEIVAVEVTKTKAVKIAESSDEELEVLTTPPAAKGAIKKEPKKPQPTLMAEDKKTVSNAKSNYEQKPQAPSAISSTTEAQLVDTSLKVVAKVDIKPEPPKSPKKGNKESMQKDSKVAVSTASPVASQTIDNKITKLADTKLYEVKVITEQPTKKPDNKTTEKATKSKEDPKTAAIGSPVKQMPTKHSTSTDVTDGVVAVAMQLSPTNANTAAARKTKDLTPVAAAPKASAWSTLSGAEMISKNLESLKSDSYSGLDKPVNSKKSAKSTLAAEAQSEKLLPDLPTPPRAPQPFKEPLSVSSTTTRKAKKSTPQNFVDFPLLKPLESLPPLPALEPLEVISCATSSVAQNTKTLREPSQDHTVSLINFESPLLENPALERKITPPPRGFTEQNLILALCGSLHYENETSEKLDVSPTLSLTRSSSALGEQSNADYKSLAENDETYMSLEQSSQETNTTNTATTNEKLSSSSQNSSASEEIIVLEEKKMSKKQRRKRQQQQLEQQLQKELKSTTAAGDDVDEELCPLIGGMSESQMETYVDNMLASSHFAPATPALLPVTFANTLLLDDSFNMPKSSAGSQLGHSTTTDSEGPMPATTSDENVCVLPASCSAIATSTPHKLKTKKLEHKINLIAAIEAATSSSSTSSAEESGVEAGGGRSHDADASLMAAVAATPILPLPQTAVAAQQNAAKKKTKRRKR